MTSTPQYVFGLHAVQALLRSQPQRAQRLLVQKERQDAVITELLKLAKLASIPTATVAKRELDQLTDEGNHQGVLLYCHKQEPMSESEFMAFLDTLTEPPLLLLLDGVTDPHNLGACFRTADAAGVHAIVAPKDKAAEITPTVSKVASGAAEVVPFAQVTNLARVMEQLKERGIWIYGAAGEASQSLYKTDLTGAAAIVMGAEGSGLRRLTQERCDVLFNIPMHGSVSSLNVSVATGIALFEAVRQRSNKK